MQSKLAWRDQDLREPSWQFLDKFRRSVVCQIQMHSQLKTNHFDHRTEEYKIHRASSKQITILAHRLENRNMEWVECLQVVGRAAFGTEGWDAIERMEKPRA